MTRQTWLADTLREAGLTITETTGWATRGAPDYNPAGVLIHHTGGRQGANSPSLNVCRDGRPGIPGPLCHLLIARDATCIVIAAGRANHAGLGGPLPGIPINQGNLSLIGIELENDGVGEPHPAIQIRAATLATAAILHRLAQPATRCWGHKEWAPSRKTDPLFDMPEFRAGVATALNKQGPPPMPDRTTIIKTSQQRLADSGGTITVDGDWGPASDAALDAVLRWQQSQITDLAAVRAELAQRSTALDDANRRASEWAARNSQLVVEVARLQALDTVARQGPAIVAIVQRLQADLADLTKVQR